MHFYFIILFILFAFVLLIIVRHLNKKITFLKENNLKLEERINECCKRIETNRLLIETNKQNIDTQIKKEAE